MNKYIPLHREWLEGITPTQLWKFLLLMLLLVVLVVCISASRGQSDTDPMVALETEGADACLPTDPLQRVAAKVLAGRYDPVKPYIRRLYLAVQQQGLTVQGRAKRTLYCYRCAGTNCNDGSPVRRGICAGSENIPMHSWIWIATDGWVKKCDTGGAVTTAHCGRGESVVVDVWVPRCPVDCYEGPGTKRRVEYAVLPPGSEREQVPARAGDSG